MNFDDITPELVAVRQAYGCPFSPDIIRALQEEGRLPPPADSSSQPPASTQHLPAAPIPQSAIRTPHSPPPPIEDFSVPNNDPAPSSPPPATPASETPSSATACDHNTSHPNAPSTGDFARSQPLLISPAPLPITEVRIAPDNLGALVSQGAPAFPDS
jgi:hypothetical protein